MKLEAEKPKKHLIRNNYANANLANNNSVRRFAGFDILKCICAFLIVIIHSPFPGMLGTYITALARIAVPIFFIITGFFYQNTIERGKERDQIKKIFILVVWANVLYILWKCLYDVLCGKNILTDFTEVVTVKALLKFLLLNVSPFGVHLWYLGAILYTLIIVAFARQKGLMQILYVLTPILLIGDLAFGKYSGIVFGREFPYSIVRNFLFVGIPYFCIGMLIFKYKHKLAHIFSGIKLAILISLFSLTTLVERYILVSYNANMTRDHYISTTFLAVTVFLFFMMVYQGRRLSAAETIAAKIGREATTWIYIIHPIFITVLGIAARQLGISGIYSFIAPFVVYIVTAALVAAVQKITNRSRLFIKSKIQ